MVLLLNIFISRSSDTRTDGSCMTKVPIGYHDPDHTQGSSTHRIVLACRFSSSDVPGSRGWGLRCMGECGSGCVPSGCLLCESAGLACVVESLRSGGSWH